MSLACWAVPKGKSSQVCSSRRSQTWARIATCGDETIRTVHPLRSPVAMTKSSGFSRYCCQ